MEKWKHVVPGSFSYFHVYLFSKKDTGVVLTKYAHRLTNSEEEWDYFCNFVNCLPFQPWPGLPGDDETNPPGMSAEEGARRRFQHMTEITILCVQAIVEFTKRIPGFLSLDRKDQIILLKTSAIEVS